ncbi:MAG: AmmeMemoRadiSam system protein B [Candidatus Eremiobacterota bacterium]
MNKDPFLPGVISLSGILILSILLTSCFFTGARGTPTAEERVEEMEKVRSSTLAGSWYKGSEGELKDQVDNYLTEARSDKKISFPGGLIVPHAGYEYSGSVAAFGYRAIKKLDIKRVIILGTCHQTFLEGLAVSAYTHYTTPLGKIPVDTAICNELMKENLFTKDEEAEKKEHSIEIQLPFLQRIAENFKIIPVMVGNLKEGDYKKVAEVMKRYVDSNTVVIASSDFTHYGQNYGYVPFKEHIPENLNKLDTGAINFILKKDVHGFLNYISGNGDTICGYSPISLLISMMGAETEGILLKYSTSGEITGDYKNSVSYASIVFMSEKHEEPTKLSTEEEQTLLKLARDTLKTYLSTGKKPDTGNYNITEILKEKRGVFVTLTEHGDLRGCIGYIEGIEPLYEAVMDNAVNAAVNDSRFSPVKEAELEDIEIEISVMTPLRPVKNIEEIQVGTHGLYIKNGYYRGVLLPQVATEYGWDRKTFLEQVSRKAGMNRNAWEDKNSVIYIFSAQIFHED